MKKIATIASAATTTNTTSSFPATVLDLMQYVRSHFGSKCNHSVLMPSSSSNPISNEFSVLGGRFQKYMDPRDMKLYIWEA